MSFAYAQLPRGEGAELIDGGIGDLGIVFIVFAIYLVYQAFKHSLAKGLGYTLAAAVILALCISFPKLGMFLYSIICLAFLWMAFREMFR